MAETTRGEFRPLSPHLQIYRWSGTMAMSIAHRLTGAALFLGMGLLTFWLVAAAIGPGAHETANGFIGSFVGRVIMIGFSWALIHHLASGLRYLIWDSGARMTRRARNLLAWGTLGMSVFLTCVVWALAVAIR